MKRTDLKVGTDYAYATSNDWASRYSEPVRVTVLDLGKWERPSGYIAARQRRDFTTADGTVYPVYGYVSEHNRASKVLVLNTRTNRAQVVAQAHLRGEWETAHEQWQQTRRLKAEAERRAADTQRALRERVDRAQQRATALLGRDVIVYGESTAHLALHHLEALLDLAEQARDQ